jgi:hypothetical protein
MGEKLSQKELALYRVVDEVLHYVWDPIGVSGGPRARDEYFSYLPKVYAMVKAGSEPEPIAHYLSEVCNNVIGLPANAEHNLKVGRILVDWREAIDESDV